MDPPLNRIIKETDKYIYCKDKYKELKVDLDIEESIDLTSREIS